jgi:hypothetical protein
MRGGRNRESTVETGRVRAGERFNSGRGNGKTDAGASNYEKKGFGGGSMQKNPKSAPRPSF